MFNSYKFISRKLIKTKEEIINLHSNSHDNNYLDVEKFKGMEEIIRTINSLSLNEINNYAKGLRKKEINMLIQYMPENQYDIDLEKIYKAVDAKSREEFIITFFRSFQNHYENVHFNKCFSQYMTKYPKSYEKLNVRENIFKVWRVWLNSEDIIKTLIDQYFKMDKSVVDYLEFLFLSSSGKLYKDCLNKLLTICRGKDYLDIGEDAIIASIEGFNSEYMISFLNNYLIKLDNEDFNDNVLAYIYDRYNTFEDLMYQFIWKDAKDQAKEKYGEWVLKKQLFDFFKGDERFSFWYEYIRTKEAKLIHVNEGQLFLDFEKFVVIEFSEINNATHVYDIDYFNERYRDDLKIQETRINDYYKVKDDAIYRVIHRKNWQEKTIETLWRLKHDTR